MYVDVCMYMYVYIYIYIYIYNIMHGLSSAPSYPHFNVGCALTNHLQLLGQGGEEFSASGRFTILYHLAFLGQYNLVQSSSRPHIQSFWPLYNLVQSFWPLYNLVQSSSWDGHVYTHDLVPFSVSMFAVVANKVETSISQMRKGS